MIDCFRSSEIADPNSDYHLESHTCFVCGAPFEPSTHLEICPKCNWYRCPDCGGCMCSLSIEDQEWLKFIRETLCQSPKSLANFSLELLPKTQNPNLREGILKQLNFCQKSARIYFKVGRE